MSNWRLTTGISAQSALPNRMKQAARPSVLRTGALATLYRRPKRRARTMPWASAGAAWGLRRQRRTTTEVVANARAVRPNAAAGPASATATPPSAGPVTRARLMATLLSVTACASSRRGTSSGMTACQAGSPATVPRPIANVSARSSAGDIRCATEVSARSALTTHIQPEAATSRRRRSTMSASAPAGSANSRPGRLIAVWTTASMKAVGASAVIWSTAPTFWIHVPSCDATEAIQIQRNTG